MEYISGSRSNINKDSLGNLLSGSPPLFTGKTRDGFVFLLKEKKDFFSNKIRDMKGRPKHLMKGSPVTVVSFLVFPSLFSTRLFIFI